MEKHLHKRSLDTYIMNRQLANSQDYSFISTALKGLASAYTNPGGGDKKAKSGSVSIHKQQGGRKNNSN